MIFDIDGKKITAKTKAAQMVYDALTGRMLELFEEIQQDAEDYGFTQLTENEVEDVKRHLENYLGRLERLVFHKAMGIKKTNANKS